MSTENKAVMIKFVASPRRYTDDIMVNNEGNGMIEQTATVVSVESGYAWIIPQQQAGGCGGCASKRSCASTASPFDLVRKEPQKMRVLNPSYARPGDTVVVGMQGDALVVYSLLAYMLPLLGMLALAVLGRETFAFFGMANELGTVFSGLLGLMGGLRLANLISLRSLQSADFQPVILRVVGQPIFSGLQHIA
ncbi:SoxR reducing system RseC family protein [Thiothrix lacustris]|uniref:SoxR reducing system RseC family protein n=1 Tax=Thiothrix lacustris TaxID=525917 RepID=A0ABY9MNQ0_9GAMM|nr:SoxR reducing system RseC family protein [Thiothrix lacustris]WML90168.1 SoxR reducing system RseC family protein [Thiothrix lacustris]